MKITKTCWGCGKRFLFGELNEGLCSTCSGVVHEHKNLTKYWAESGRHIVHFKDLIAPLNDLKFWYGFGFGVLFLFCSILAFAFYLNDKCRINHNVDSCVIRVEPK